MIDQVAIGRRIYGFEMPHLPPMHKFGCRKGYLCRSTVLLRPRQARLLLSLDSELSVYNTFQYEVYGFFSRHPWSFTRFPSLLSMPNPLLAHPPPPAHATACTVIFGGGHQKGPELNYPEVVVYKEEAALPTHLIVYALHE